MEAGPIPGDQHGCRRIVPRNHPPAHIGKPQVWSRFEVHHEKVAFGVLSEMRGCILRSARTRPADVTIHARWLRDDLEPSAHVAAGFGRAEQKDTVVDKREMKQRNDFRLRFRPEIDQHVPAGDQVQPRKWRIAQQVLHGEHRLRAQVVADPVAAFIRREIARQPLRRDISGNGWRIDPGARRRDGVGIYVRSKDLQANAAPVGFNRLAQQHGERPGLFARTASRDPHAQRPLQPVVAHEVGYHAFF